MYVQVSYLQKLWLQTRGGRNESDVFIDEEGRKYVVMGGTNRMEKVVYVPHNEEIIQVLNIKKI